MWNPPFAFAKKAYSRYNRSKKNKWGYKRTKKQKAQDCGVLRDPLSIHTLPLCSIHHPSDCSLIFFKNSAFCATVFARVAKLLQ